MKKWTILSKSKIRNKQEIVKILLANRGIKTEKETKEFLNPPQPNKLTVGQVGIDMREITKAAKRIKKAIKSGEKIIVYGDYDTDGVCATAIMWETLHRSGAKVMPFIPKREEGYGMKVARIEEFQKEGVSLIVTVDQGIIARDQVKHAQTKGIDVIVTDHHPSGRRKPEAYAVIHTTQLAGCGVAWVLASQWGKIGLELVTIGTVSDVMPLLGANRVLVKHGLPEVRQTKIPGLVALYAAAGVLPEKIGIYEIGFIIGPRLNAAGRMEDPMEALRLLCTPKKERAEDLATKIDQQNRQRQVLTQETTIHARQLWLAEDGQSKLIFVAHESYEEGIVGLVAGRLMEEFSRPAIIVSRGEKFSRASARSINGFNIAEAIGACGDILGPHGGHPQAAGFTIETIRLEELKRRLLEIAESQIDQENLTPILKIDTELDCHFLNSDLWGELQNLEPFGVGNPEPVFLTRDFEVIEARLVGKDSQHLKLRVACSKSPVVFDAIGFNFGKFAGLSPEKKIDLVYNLQKDEWNGDKRIQLKIKDLRLSDGS